MKYLKVVNCPLGVAFPAVKGRIDFPALGFSADSFMRNGAQGFGDVEQTEYLSIHPIEDEDKFLASGILEKVNSNDNPADTADIITEAEANAVKTAIADTRDIGGLP